MNYEDYVRDIPDWPKEGVVFKDVTPLMANAEVFHQSIIDLASFYRDKGITKVLGAEARGFLFASAVAFELGAGFVPARKPGKLPYETVSESYELEYGINQLELHVDSLTPDDRVLIVDDVLATGGTARAKAHLADTLGAQVVGYSFVIELDFLHGRDKLDSSLPIVSLMHVS